MLAIRMQRTGRKGYAMFRMVVQDSRRSPSSGKVVAYIGSYDPHTKKIQLDKEKAGYYLEHGAQPSPRVVGILKEEKVKLPAWVKEEKTKAGSVRNPDKRRSTAPEEEKPAEQTAVTEEAPKDEPESPESSTEADTAEPEAAADSEEQS